MLSVRNYLNELRKSRSVKVEDKVKAGKLEEIFNKDVEILRAKLLAKLFELTNGKTSQGVDNNYNEDLIPKGTKFTQKNISALDFSQANFDNWTTDKEKNALIVRILKNYMFANTMSYLLASNEINML